MLKKKNIKREKISFHFHTGLMKNPEIRKKQEEWHPCEEVKLSRLSVRRKAHVLQLTFKLKSNT